MDTITKLQKLEKRIEQVKSELMKLGEMRPGSLSQQYNVCGSPGCRCKDPKNPQPHGPYYQISYTHLGKSTSQAVPRSQVTTVKRQLANYKKFRDLIERWIALALEYAKLKMTRDKDS